jgi:hypothetical protein
MFGNIGLIRDSRDLKRQLHRCERMKKVTQPQTPIISHSLSDRMGACCIPSTTFSDHQPIQQSSAATTSH